jgi:DNA-binding LacI/PurR family transcriptional regulator
VSQALVSRALTGTSGDIAASPVTVEKIRKMAAEWNYSPNAAALTLKGAPTRTLAVIIKNFDDPFFGRMIRIFQGLAREQGYALLLVGWEEGNPSLTDETVLRKYQPDGLIVCGSDYGPPAVKSFLDEGKRVVQIGLGRVMPGVRQVVVDEAAGLQRLVEFLLGQGHVRIGYIGDSSLPQLRRESLLQASLRAKKLKIHPEWFVRLASSSVDSVNAAVRTLLAPGDGGVPSVVIAADDSMAQQVMRAFYEHGVRVPWDISLAGIDDIPASSTMIPALTSVCQPMAEMVRQAWRLVTGEGCGEANPLVIAPSLSVRESCAAPGAGRLESKVVCKVGVKQGTEQSRSGQKKGSYEDINNAGKCSGKF